MILADIFGSQDAAVIITAIIGAIVTILKFIPQRESKSQSNISESLADVLSRLKVLEFQAEQVWDFVFRRASTEVVLSGKGSANSPLTFAEEYAKLFDPLKYDLQEWYKKSTASGINERDILIWMEGRFGERILDICLANRIPYGAGRLMAYAIAQNSLTIEVPGGSLTCSPPEIKGELT